MPTYTIIITLTNLLFIAGSVGLGAFVFGRAGGHRPALWLLAYSIALSLVNMSVLLARYATDEASGLLLESLRGLFLVVLSYTLLQLFAALFVPEWWEGRRPIRWISLPYPLFGLFVLIDLIFGLGLISGGFVERQGIFSASPNGPLGPIVVGIFITSWLVHISICLVSFIRRPALRTPILILGGSFAVTLVGGVAVSLLLDLPDLGVLMGLPFVGALAFAVFRSRLFVTTEIATGMALQAMGDAVVVVEKGMVSYTNPAAAGMGVHTGQAIRASLLAAGMAPEVLADLERRVATNDHSDLAITLNSRRLSIDWARIHTPRGEPVGALYIGRDVTELEQRNAELAGERARLQDLVHALEAERHQSTQLASLVRGLSLPVIPVLDGVLALPLVGDFDAERGDQLTDVLLQAIERQHAHTVLIDITGVPLIDTNGAAQLLRTVDAARLLGARCVLVGVRPEIAQSIVALGIDLVDLPTAATLQQAVAGIRNVKRTP